MYISAINEYQNNNLGGREYNLNTPNQEYFNPLSPLEEPYFSNIFPSNLSPKPQEKNFFNFDKLEFKEIKKDNPKQNEITQNKNQKKEIEKKLDNSNNKLEKNNLGEEIKCIEIIDKNIDLGKLKRLNKYGDVISPNIQNLNLKPKFIVVKNNENNIKPNKMLRKKIKKISKKNKNKNKHIIKNNNNKKSILGFNNNYGFKNIPKDINKINFQQTNQNLNFINNNNKINNNINNYNNNNINTSFNYNQNMPLNNETNSINSKFFFRDEYQKNLNLYYKTNIKFNNIDESRSKKNINKIFNLSNDNSSLNNNFRPQIFESKNSSTMINGIEYTTLLVPKNYVEKIKELIIEN